MSLTILARVLNKDGWDEGPRTKALVCTGKQPIEACCECRSLRCLSLHLIRVVSVPITKNLPDSSVKLLCWAPVAPPPIIYLWIAALQTHHLDPPT